jgi:hypothetical protein
VAAPTSVRVEATSISTTVIRWSYAGSSPIAVYRSTDGSSYSEITSANDGTRVPSGTASYTDIGLSTATKYWYKLSDDSGSTFSSVVTVYTHACLDSPDGSDSFSLPRTGGGDPAEEFDELAKRVEEVMGARVLEPQQCATCPVDGAVVINCASGCHDWVVIADEDINSISMQWCDNGQATVEFLIPPNTTRQICGFAGGFGFTGDECTQAPIVAGANGRSVTVSTTPASGGKASPKDTGSKPSTAPGPGNGGANGAACNCVPNGNGALTIKSCNANNSLACSGQKFLNLVACGGRKPYTWSHTGSVTLSSTDREATSVAPPTNSGSGVAGTAYAKVALSCYWFGAGAGICGPGGGSSILNQISWQDYGCNDAAIGGCNTADDTGAIETGCPSADPTSPCVAGTCPQTCSSGNCSGQVAVFVGGGSPCAGGNLASSSICDKRTAPMIALGCSPCGLNAGATVTVTDALGTQVTIILQA